MLPSSARGALAVCLAALAPLLGCPPDDGSLPQAFPALPEGVGSATGAPSAPSSADPNAEVVRVCLMLPSSGPSKDVGAEIRRGIAIAQAELGRRTGDKRRFEWTEKDTKSTEPGALGAFQECFNEGHAVMIGPVHPAGVTALIPVAAAHQAVLVIPEIGAAVPSVWGPNLFAMGPPATQMGRIAGADAAARGLVKAGVVHVPSVFGAGLRDAFQRAFVQEGKGASVVGAAEVPPDQPDAWAKAASELIGKGAQALFIVGPPDASKAVAALLSDAASTAHAWFVDWSMHPPVLAAAGESGRARVHWVNRSLPRGAFEAAYVEKYQARPEYPAGSGYDAAMTVARAALEGPSGYWEDIANTLRELKDVGSAFGTGQMAVYEDLVYLDVAGYRLIEPVQLPESGEWIFGGFE